MTPDQLRDRLVTCLGGPWPVPCPVEPVLRCTHRGDGYRIESLTYQVEPGDRVPAVLLVPDGATAENPAPAIAVWHQHAGQYHLGKSEPAGLGGDPAHHTGAALAKEGYVVLCPDALCFEERRDPEDKLDGGDYERFEFLRYLVDGKCLAWKNILDVRRAVDFLTERPEVDGGRIGCYGHSMGATHAWLAGPHEPRIKAHVANCCLPTYAAIHEEKLLHCFSNFVPGWQPCGDIPAMAALIAPRALHLNLGEDDEGSPVEHAEAGIEEIKKAYEALGAAENFSAFVEPGVGHVLSPSMWKKSLAFFEKHLFQ
ncbi:MAG: dienelactone hydrolase family protein [Verrucomicrobiales bacterium]